MNTVYTVGHSTRTAEEFAALVKTFEVEQLADTRTIPRSRKNPQFESAALRHTLQQQGIAYLHLPELGGLRHPRKDSLNTAWRNDSFRGYADYMQTSEFAAALDRLIGLSAMRITAIMCAEAVPWRCHRSLVADALLIRDIPVVDILSATNSKQHQLTAWARVDGLRITYPIA
ncbi:MAG: DUF488 domain-containing protein [Acidobacteriaceae bacterium]|nr:DUF488 domain-containing protein [Acidobacteriaceae bacterium]